MSKLYVAYGSNLYLHQMAVRCPTARVICSGILNNWELIFRGSRTGSYASIRKHKGCCVPVAIWSIEKYDEMMLDRYEGYPHFYYKQNVFVQTDTGRKKAMVYIMNIYALPGIPSDYYVDIIKNGYKDNNLDISVLEQALENNFIETK